MGPKKWSKRANQLEKTKGPSGQAGGLISYLNGRETLSPNVVGLTRNGTRISLKEYPAAMTKIEANDAYREAQQRIAAARSGREPSLDLNTLGFTTLPPEIGSPSPIADPFLYGNEHPPP